MAAVAYALERWRRHRDGLSGGGVLMLSLSALYRGREKEEEEERAGLQRARARRQWRTRRIGEWVAVRCDAQGRGVVDAGGRSLVLAVVLGSCGQLSRAFGASLPGNCEGDRRSEEGDDEADNGNSCSTTNHRKTMPPPCFF